MQTEQISTVNPVVLNEDNYFDMPLFHTVQGAIDILKKHGTPKTRLRFTDQGNVYTFHLMEAFSSKYYTLAELEEWIRKGDLVDTAEMFSNLYKSTHGVRPRHGSPEDWLNIDWLKNQINDLRD